MWVPSLPNPIHNNLCISGVQGSIMIQGVVWGRENVCHVTASGRGLSYKNPWSMTLWQIEKIAFLGSPYYFLYPVVAFMLGKRLVRATHFRAGDIARVSVGANTWGLQKTRRGTAINHSTVIDVLHCLQCGVSFFKKYFQLTLLEVESFFGVSFFIIQCPNPCQKFPSVKPGKSSVVQCTTYRMYRIVSVYMYNLIS